MLTNIFSNNFYNRPKEPKWAWELNIVANPNEGWTDDEMSVFSKAITKVDIPSLEMLTVQSQYFGLTFDIPTRIENTGELTLTFNENSDMELYQSLKEKLYYTSFNDEFIKDDNSVTDGQYLLYYAPFDVNIVLYSPSRNNEKVSHFYFKKCFITDVSDVELAYDSEDVVEYTVKIHYNFRFEGADADEYYEKISGNEKQQSV